MTRYQLRPGDCLLYAPQGLWSYAIAIKTWNKVSHCEGFIGFDAHGQGWSVASRDGIGVGRYPLRTKGLSYVCRPTEPFDLQAAMRWFDTVNGQGYDWTGLARFLTWGALRFLDDKTKQFCSEFLLRWFRAGRFHPINQGRDADSVAPAHFLYSPCMECHDYIKEPDPPVGRTCDPAA